MKKPSLILSRTTLLTIYKSFVRPNIDYADMIYYKPFHESFKNKLETVQYRVALVIRGAFKSTSRHRLYKELGLESLAQRRWCQKLVLFHKILDFLAPSYVQSYVNNRPEPFYQTTLSGHSKYKSVSTRTKTF